MKSFTFQPTIRFVDFPSRSIAFDTQLGNGGHREIFAKVVSIETQETVVESFVCAKSVDFTDDDLTKQRFVTAPIIYVQKFPDNREETKELATVRLSFTAEKIKGKFNYPDINDIEFAINRRLADALMLAIDIKLGTTASAESIPLGNNVIRGSFGHRSANHVASEKKGLSTAKAAAIALFFPIAITLIWAVGKTTSPTDQVSLSRFANDPEAIASQVETTKAVLKNMGLDPGNSGDLGCLATQP